MEFGIEELSLTGPRVFPWSTKVHSQTAAVNVWPTVARTVSLTDVESHHKLATVIALSAGARVPLPQHETTASKLGKVLVRPEAF